MDAHPPLPPELREPTPPAAQAAMVAQLRAEMAQVRATVEELPRPCGGPYGAERHER